MLSICKNLYWIYEVCVRLFGYLEEGGGGGWRDLEGKTIVAVNGFCFVFSLDFIFLIGE